jgi:hypothetical protein
MNGGGGKDHFSGGGQRSGKYGNGSGSGKDKFGSFAAKDQYSAPTQWAEMDDRGKIVLIFYQYSAPTQWAEMDDRGKFVLIFLLYDKTVMNILYYLCSNILIYWELHILPVYGNLICIINGIINGNITGRILDSFT